MRDVEIIAKVLTGKISSRVVTKESDIPPKRYTRRRIEEWNQENVVNYNDKRGV